MKQQFLLVILSTFTFFAAMSESCASKYMKKDLLIELTGKDALKVSETKLYGNIVMAYKKNDEISLVSKVDAMITRFPNGRLTDNAIYIAGKYELENKNYAKALKYFNLISKQYPLSDKIIASQFARGIAYKQIHLNDLAKKVFKDLRKKYPGSPEYFLAETEIHSLN